jgi:hypothetical protein
LAAWGSNPDHYSASALLALNHAAQIEPHKSDKRYARQKGGKFTNSQDVGHSLAANRRKPAKCVIKRGGGITVNCGHSQRRLTDAAAFIRSCARDTLAILLQPISDGRS